MQATNTFRFAEIAQPQLKDEQYFGNAELIPLPLSEFSAVLCDGLLWSEILWGTQSLILRPGQHSEQVIEPLRNFKFRQVLQRIDGGV